MSADTQDRLRGVNYEHGIPGGASPREVLAWVIVNDDERAKAEEGSDFTPKPFFVRQKEVQALVDDPEFDPSAHIMTVAEINRRLAITPDQRQMIIDQAVQAALGEVDLEGNTEKAAALAAEKAIALLRGEEPILMD